jgi:hypothetical protein
MGPIPTSYDGKNYIMTVLDDDSKLASVVTMKSKDEASAYLIHICNQLENKTGLKIKAIRSDNAGEYINAAIAQFTLRARVLTLSTLHPTCPSPMGQLRTSSTSCKPRPQPCF